MLTPLSSSSKVAPDGASATDDDALLDALQRDAFAYFLEQYNPENGLIADTSKDGAPVSIAVVGLGLSSYPIAVEQGWISREDAVQRSLAALRFFKRSDQTGKPDSTGYKGFYFHFLDQQTGKRVWQCELSMIDTTMLIAGVLTAAMYFDGDQPDERELRETADMLYRRIDWRWAQDGADTINQGWKPESGFLKYGWEGYSEAIVLYALAMGSPTHPVSQNCYHAWTLTYQWENLYDVDYLYAGPLFVHQFSHAWFDMRGIRDPFMREKDSDYFENSRRAVCIQREYCRINPLGHTGFDGDCWGLSACDGPNDDEPDVQGERRRLFGYAARGVPYGPDDGTLSPPAVLGCLPFQPDMVMQAIKAQLERYPEIRCDGRLTSGFNPGFGSARPWVSPGHFGLDQGIIVMMIANHRTETIWHLTRACPYVINGLRSAGFRGGWLDHARPRAAL